MSNSTTSFADRKIGPSKLRAPVCPWCGSNALDLGPGSGPHPASIVCQDCGRHVRWCGKPIDQAEAAAFVMPFGMHRGTPMGSLPAGYLRWIRTNIKGRFAEHAAVLLGEDPA